MAYGSTAHEVLRSFLPTPYLRRRRDVWALGYKYLAREQRKGRLHGVKADRLSVLLDSDCWRPPQEEPLNEYHTEKFIGSMCVDGRSPSPLSAYDPNDPTIRIREGKKDATMLHVHHIDGFQQMRADLGQVAEYIDTHKRLRRTPSVLVATYPEMASLAARIGFLPLELESVQISLGHEIGMVYGAFNALRKRNAPLEVAALYMPTAEFTGRFG